MPLESTPNLRARRYQPTRTLPLERPRLPPQPCAACGADVDPLRAPCVLAFEDGVRLLCSEDCKADHRSGERSRRKLARAAQGALSAAPLPRDDETHTTTSLAADADRAPAPPGARRDSAPPARRRATSSAPAPLGDTHLLVPEPLGARGPDRALRGDAREADRALRDRDSDPSLRTAAGSARGLRDAGRDVVGAGRARREAASSSRAAQRPRGGDDGVLGVLERRLQMAGAAWPAAEAGHAAASEPLDRSLRAWLLWLGAATIGTATTLACFPGPETAFASAVLSTLAAFAALRLSAHNIPEVGLLGWLLGPLGAVLAAIAAYPTTLNNDSRLPLFGAIVAAGAMLVRSLLDTHARRPVDQTLHQLVDALPALVRLPPRTFGRDADEGDDMTGELTDTARIRVGEEILVRRGELVGVDGVVVAGAATLLPHPGATSTLRRGPGDAVLAGARIGEGVLRIQATRVGDDRTLARVARCGQAGLRDSAPFLRATQLLTSWSAVLVLLACVGLVVFARVEGLPLPLAAASAILLAAPLLAVRRAAEWSLLGAATTSGTRGILFQSGATLDLAGQVRVVAMAPHRTLTEGKPEVIDVYTLGDNPGHELFGLVAGAELAAGDHPIGRALAAFAAKRGIAPSEARRAIAVPGRGLTAIGPQGEEVVIGSRRLLLDQGVSVAVADAYAARAEAAGRTAVFVSVSGRVRAVFTLQDHLRAGARAAVQRLFDLGLEVVLLTGDQRGPIEQLAAGFDIAHIKCELLPDERADEVRGLRDADGPVAFIGYPGEDAAALAAADVAIALGAAGGAGGDNSIALVGEDLRDAAAALWIARAARSRALGSMRIAAITFLGVAAAAVAGLIEPGIAVLIALLVDVEGIQAGARLLRRISLRMPQS